MVNDIGIDHALSWQRCELEFRSFSAAYTNPSVWIIEIPAFFASSSKTLQNVYAVPPIIRYHLNLSFLIL
jgi:hypothetical protein